MTTVATSKEALAQAKTRMEKAIEDFRKDLAGIRTGRANVARDKACVLGRVRESAVVRFRLGMLTIWESMHPPPGASGAYPVGAGFTSRSRRPDNQPERVGASRRPSRLTETNFAP